MGDIPINSECFFLCPVKFWLCANIDLKTLNFNPKNVKDIGIHSPAFSPKTLYYFTKRQLCQWCRLAHNRIQSFNNFLYWPKIWMTWHLVRHTTSKLNSNNHYSWSTVVFVTHFFTHFCATHFIYNINRAIATKVDSTYLGYWPRAHIVYVLWWELGANQWRLDH